MNHPFDYNVTDDFVNMCCKGELRPNKSIEIRNFAGDKIITFYN